MQGMSQLDSTAQTDCFCKLEELFRLQAALNDHVFKSKHITDHTGEVLTMQKLLDDAKSGALTARSVSVEWAVKYLRAMQAEAIETSEELPIKWWSDRSVDISNLQEEVIDQLHFWISQALAVGMTASDVFHKYMEKNAVNISRINTGYVERVKEGKQTNV